MKRNISLVEHENTNDQAPSEAKRQRTGTSTLTLLLAPLRQFSPHLTLLILSFLNGAEILRQVCYPHNEDQNKFTSTLIQWLKN